MRLALIWTMVLTTLLILTLCYILVYMVIIDKDPDYSGMALLIGGWSTFAGVVIYGKVKQTGNDEYVNYPNRYNNGQFTDVMGNGITTGGRYNDDVGDSNDVNITINKPVNKKPPPKGNVI